MSAPSIIQPRSLARPVRSPVFVANGMLTGSAVTSEFQTFAPSHPICVEVQDFSDALSIYLDIESAEGLRDALTQQIEMARAGGVS